MAKSDENGLSKGSKKGSAEEQLGAEGHISRDDVEAKFRQLTGDVNETAEQMTKVAAAVGGALLALLLIIVFLTGRRKGQKKTTVVEVIRI